MYITYILPWKIAIVPSYFSFYALFENEMLLVLHIEAFVKSDLQLMTIFGVREIFVSNGVQWEDTERMQKRYH